MAVLRELITSFASPQDFVWAVMPPKRDNGVRTMPETHVPAMYIVSNINNALRRSDWLINKTTFDGEHHVRILAGEYHPFVIPVDDIKVYFFNAWTTATCVLWEVSLLILLFNMWYFFRVLNIILLEVDHWAVENKSKPPPPCTWPRQCGFGQLVNCYKYISISVSH